MKIGKKFTLRGVKYEFLGIAGRGSIRVRQIGSGEVTRMPVPLPAPKRDAKARGRKPAKEQVIGYTAKTTAVPPTAARRPFGITVRFLASASAVERISIRNGMQLSCPESFDVFAVGNRHCPTPFSERQYQGGSTEEALIAACENMLKPSQICRVGYRRRRQTQRDCYSEIDDGVIGPWDFASFQDEPRLSSKAIRDFR